MKIVHKLTVSFGTGQQRHVVTHYYSEESFAHGSYQQYADRQKPSERPPYCVERVVVHENITEI